MHPLASASVLLGGLPVLQNPLPPTLAAFWTPYADWIYMVVSTSLLLAVVLLVLRPGNR